MASQLYGISGKRVNPNTVAQINQQAQYLPALYRQKKEDALAKRGLDLQERAINTNQELSEDALAEQKRQAKLANYLGLGNLAVKGGLGAYQASDTVKDTVDKFLGGGASGLADTVSKAAPSVGNDIFSQVGGGTTGMLDWLQGSGGTMADIAGTAGSEIVKNLVGGGASDAISSVISSGSPYADYITSTMDYLGSLF